MSSDTKIMDHGGTHSMSQAKEDTANELRGIARTSDCPQSETRSPIRIPLELIDMIIDYVYNDPHTLATCGLVCRAWLPSSRYHLLSDGVIIHGDNMRTVYNLLVSPLSTISSAIRDLHLSYGWTLDDTWIQVIPVLVSVTWLFMDEAPSFQLTLPGFRSLIRLELSAFQMDSLEATVELICSFPLLETLGLRHIHWKKTKQVSPGQYHLSCHLHTLHLASQTRDLMDWFSQEPVSALRNLHLEDVRIREVHSANALLRKIGDGLRHLKLEFFRGRIGDVTTSEIDLRHNTSLRSLFINPKARNFGVEVSRDILARVCSPKLEEVKLRLLFIPLQALSHSPWASLDDVLSSSYFSNLELIFMTGNACEPDIRERMPASHARGILQIRGFQRRVD